MGLYRGFRRGGGQRRSGISTLQFLKSQLTPKFPIKPTGVVAWHGMVHTFG